MELYFVLIIKYNKEQKTRRLQPAGFFCSKINILEAPMNYVQTGFGRNVFYSILRYRLFQPYGRIVTKSSYFFLLNYDKKVLVNTGVIENLAGVQFIMSKAGINFQDIDYIINMTYRPEHIGLNAVIQSRNDKIQFLAHPIDVSYIENTVFQYEERYVPGFYKLVSGNTENIRLLKDGEVIDLGQENIRIYFHRDGHPDGNTEDGRFSLYLTKSGIIINSDEIKPAILENRESRELLMAG
jgi:hypothetical protein